MTAEALRRRQLGYFISYDNLFSTWLNKGKDFDVSNVTDALSAFKRLIDPKHKKVFEDLFAAANTKLTEKEIKLLEDEAHKANVKILGADMFRLAVKKR